MRALILAFALAGCGGIAGNTTIAETAGVRAKMVETAVPGFTTEATYVTRWGLPTQKVREGGEVRYIYRNMRNAGGYYWPNHGSSTDYVIVRFQYGLVAGAYSSDMEGCRATFPPRPPNQRLDNPFVIHPANCGPEARAAAIRAVPHGIEDNPHHGPVDGAPYGSGSGDPLTAIGPTTGVPGSGTGIANDSSPWGTGKK